MKIIFLNDSVSSYLDNSGRTHLWSLDENHIFVRHSYTQESINDYDAAIITIKSYEYSKDYQDYSSSKNCIRRKQEILRSLKDGKIIILFVESQDALLKFIANQFNIKTDNIKDFSQDLKTDIEKYENIVEDYCNITVSFSGENITPICSFGSHTCGFQLNAYKGKLIVLPVVLKDNGIDYCTKLIISILKIVYSQESEFILPKYLEELKILDEEKLIKDKKIAIERINEIDSYFEQINSIKSILVLKHNILVDKIIQLLNEIGITTFKEEKFEEDLWITENNKNKIIIEVKGTRTNFTRKYLNDLDNHREENDLTEDFPALLIANTFAEAESYQEKDIPPESDTLNRAKSQKIMITRTLDLFNLYILIKNGTAKINDFLNILKEKECGWIKITNKIEIVRA